MGEIDAVKLFSTCPQSKDVGSQDYLRRVVEVSRWSEEFGCEGILVYTDNGIADPWLVSQAILENTARLCPLVAIQPVYMHPYSAAKMVATLAYLHGRRIWLNMLAGGFKNDLQALNDLTPHDERYERTVEYTLIIKDLLSGPGPVTREGKYYKVTNLKMAPPLPAGLMPGILISGSSDAGMAAARAIGATAVKYPRPPGEEQEDSRSGGVEAGFRVGIIAREAGEEAWRVARERFPEDRKGQITQKLATKVSDSHWHRQLSEMEVVEDVPDSDRSPYWLGPFQNYKTFCPYLVGSYDRVAEEVSRYLALGFRTIILDIPPCREELEHSSRVFRMAASRLAESSRPEA